MADGQLGLHVGPLVRGVEVSLRWTLPPDGTASPGHGEEAMPHVNRAAVGGWGLPYSEKLVGACGKEGATGRTGATGRGLQSKCKLNK